MEVIVMRVCNCTRNYCCSNYLL